MRSLYATKSGLAGWLAGWLTGRLDVKSRGTSEVLDRFSQSFRAGNKDDFCKTVDP